MPSSFVHCWYPSARVLLTREPRGRTSERVDPAACLKGVGRWAGEALPTTHYPVIPRAVLYTDWKTLSDATDVFVVIIALFDA